jgi:SAM-dependent methyltransferase
MIENNSHFYFESKGYCPICNINTTFIAKNEWFRDFLVCQNCHSIPRERALMVAIESYFPQWRQSTIHESSPSNRGTSLKLAKECHNYIESQYFSDCVPGSLVNGVRCENLESLSFSDESIDLHITQDVFEHIFNPAKAFKEIARTLKPGGMHIFSVPLVNKNKPSNIRAKIEKNEIIHLLPPEYHHNPVAKNSLVTMDWGYDITEYIFKNSGSFTTILYIDDLTRGIHAELIEILISIKPI